MSGEMSGPVRVGTALWDPRGGLSVQLCMLGDLLARWDLSSSSLDEAGIRFPARSAARWWGGEATMAQRVVEHLVEAGAFQVGVAVAPGRLLSWVMCRRARARGLPVVVPDDHADRLRSRLPVGVLSAPGSPVGLDPTFVERLMRLGLRRLGDVAALSVADLVGRFGEPGRQAHRWASGVEPPLATSVMSQEISVELDFEPPVEQADAVAFAGRRLADRLDARLRRRGEVATAVRITIDTDHAEHIERVWSHSEGLHPSALVDRVRWQLQGWHAGPVVLLRLTAIEVSAERGRQQGWWGGEAHGDERAARAVARLTGLIGDQAIHRLQWCGGRDPVDRYERLTASSTEWSHRSTAVVAPWSGGLPAPSPARILLQPQPVELLDDTGRLVQVSGRGEVSAEPASMVSQGATRREVVAWAGPWPLEERWWRPTEHRRRARLQLVTADGSAWLVHLQHRQWWLGGQYC